jgi:tetratricopeptide (TPR) repeat protein
LANQQRDQAERTLREGDPVHSNPDLQVALVRFLAMTRQVEKAEKTLDQAVGKLQDQLPQGLLALARCSELIGQTYKAISQDEQKLKIWTDKASQWYKLAEQARPDDFEVTRQFVDFQIRAGQNTEVEKYLRNIIANNTSASRTQDQIAWARRALALALLLSKDHEQAHKALDLVKPIEQYLNSIEPQNKEAARPEDLRILARVYEAQGTQEYHAKGRKVIEDLVASGTGNAEDRLLLAGIYSKDGEWVKAQGQYEQLIKDTENTNNLELLARRPDYLAQYADELLKQYKESKDSTLLDSAQSLVAKLKQVRPDSLSGVTLEVRIYAAQDQPSKAIELLEKLANDPKVPDVVLLALAKEAEALSLLDLAERLIRQTFNRADVPQNRIALASFLGRHGRVKEGLDLCEPLWNKDIASDAILPQLLDIVFSSTGRNDQVQVGRLASWIERALGQKPKSSSLMMALANLRERQGKFQEAEALYRQEIEQDTNNIIALNNLAWLMALRKDQSGIALNLINRAIARKGPVPELLDTRGVVYMMSGDLQNAVQDLSRASELDPTGPKLFHLAQAYLQASNRENASQALAKARAKGLKQEDLHPLEETSYLRMLNDLGVR